MIIKKAYTENQRKENIILNRNLDLLKWILAFLSIMIIYGSRLSYNKSPWCIIFLFIVWTAKHLYLNSTLVLWCVGNDTCKITKRMLYQSNKSHKLLNKWQIQVDSWRIRKKKHEEEKKIRKQNKKKKRARARMPTIK